MEYIPLTNFRVPLPLPGSRMANPGRTRVLLTFESELARISQWDFNTMIVCRNGRNADDGGDVWCAMEGCRRTAVSSGEARVVKMCGARWKAAAAPQ